MDFTMGGLIGALVANVFAAFKGNESKKLMDSDPALKTRIGGTGNQFAIMTMYVRSTSTSTFWGFGGGGGRVFFTK